MECKGNESSSVIQPFSRKKQVASLEPFSGQVPQEKFYLFLSTKKRILMFYYTHVFGFIQQFIL